MHQALFAHQKELGEIDYSHLALTLGMEIYKYESSRPSPKHARRIAADYDSGVRSGVTKTPTLFINDRRYDGAIEAKAIVAAGMDAIRRR